VSETFESRVHFATLGAINVHSLTETIVLQTQCFDTVYWLADRMYIGRQNCLCQLSAKVPFRARITADWLPAS